MNQTTTLTNFWKACQTSVLLMFGLFFIQNGWANSPSPMAPESGNRFLETGIFAPCGFTETQLFRHGKTHFGDMDRDGDVDLVLVSPFDGQNSRSLVYENDGLGGFSESTARFFSENDGSFDPLRFLKEDEKLLTSTAGNTGPYAQTETIQLFASHGLSWVWSGPGGFTSTLQNPTRAAATPAMSGSYSVTVTLTGGVTETASTTVTVNPTVIICHGQTAKTFSISAVAGATSYLWSIGNDSAPTAIVSGQGTTSITVDLTALADGEHLICVTAVGASCSSFPTCVNINLPPILNVTASNTGPYCVGGTVQLNSTPTGGTAPYTYAWSGPTAFSPNNVQNPSFTATSTSFNGTYNLTVTDANGCTTVTSTPVTVVADPTVTATPAAATICTGGNTTITAAVSGGTGTVSYQWQSGPSAGGPWTNMGTASTQNTGAISATTYYQVIVTQTGGGCSVTGTATVNVVPVQTISIAGATTICTGGGATLTATVSGGTGVCGITWEKSTDSGSTWSSAGSGASISPTNITLTTIFRAKYNCTGGNCGEITSNTQTVTVVADPTISITGADETICVGGSLTLSSSVSGGVSCTIAWEVSTDGGTTWTSAGSGASISTGVLNSVGTARYRANYNCTGVGCDAAQSNVRIITIVADPVASAPAGATVCQGGPLTLTSTVTGGTGTFSYQWEQSANGTSGWVNAVGGTGATTTSYSPPTATVGTLYYRMHATQTGTGCSDAFSSNATVIVTPVATVTQTGTDVTICSGGDVSFSASYTNGTGTPAWQWQSSPDGTAWTDISGATSSSYTATGITATTWYRAELTLTGSGCGVVYSAARKVTIVPDPSVSISGANSICVGGSDTLTAVVLNGTGTCGITWESSPNGSTGWTVIAGQTTATLIITPATTTWYRANYTCDGVGCNSVPSNTQNVIVNPDPTATDPTGGIVCQNGPITLTSTASGGTGAFSYQWQQSATGTGGWSSAVGGSGATTTSFSPSTATLGTMYYRMTATQLASGCNVANSDTAKVVVVAAPTVAISGLTPTICTGGGDTLTANISNGIGVPSYLWQSSPNGSTWTNVSGGTSQTLIVSNVTATTHYRVSVTLSGSGCGSATSSAVILTVVPDPTITISGANSICIGGSDTLTAVVGNGTGVCGIVWEESPNGTSGWTVIAGETTTTLIISPSATTWYRAKYSCNGVDCNQATSNTQNVIVNPDPTATDPTGGIVCQNGPITLTSTASGGTGAFSYQWQQSATGTGGWSSASGGSGATTTSFSPSTASLGTMYYRMTATQLASGCNVANSDTAKVIVVPAPTVSISGLTPTICTGGGDTLTANISNGIGVPSYLWQSSPNGSTWTNVSGGTSQTLIVSNVTATTHYRVSVTLSGSGCGSATSSAVILTVVPDPTITISGANSICIGGSDTLTAVVGNGTGVCGIVWEQSPNGSTGWVVISGQTTTTLIITPSATTYYRAKYACNGTDCQQATSNSQTVTVVADPIISAQPVGDTVCVNGPTSISVTATGGVGIFHYDWEQGSSSTGPWSPAPGATDAATYVPPTSTIGSKWYRVVVSQTGTNCNSITSSVVEIKVKAAPTVTIAGATTICSGGSATLTSAVTSGTGSVSYQWQYDNGGTWTDLGAPGGTGNSLSVSNLTATRVYRLLVTIGGSGCGQITSNTQTVTVVADPSISVAITGADTICAGSTTTLTATPAGGTGTCTIQWQFYNTETSSWENISGANSATLTTVVLTATRKYRATYSCTGVGCDPATSNEVTVVVYPNPIVTIPPPPSICPGQGVTLTANVTGNPNDFNYQWQLSADNSSWTNISGATQQSYTAAYLVTTTYFRVIVTLKEFACTTTSASATVTVLPAPPKPGPISY